ncbi:MAG: hypothetical protein ACI4J7_03015 [Ruminiclostridium sp.]
MATKIVDMKYELRKLRFKMKFIQDIECTNEENKKYAEILKNGGQLPEGVFQYKNDEGELIDLFYTVYDSGLTNEEKNEYIQYKKLTYIKTIKNCIVFFTAIAAISILFDIIILLLR